jgi:hypothetical protein
MGGTGGGGHIAGFFFQRETGTRFQFVPYRGASPAIQDLVAGQIDMAITDPIVALPQVRAGTIKAFGVTTKTRVPSAPDIPTLDEAGLPGFDISLWHALWLPKGTPKDIIARLNAAVKDALADPMVRARLVDLAQEAIPPAQQTPEALGVLHKAEIEKWWPIIKAANIKLSNPAGRHSIRPAHALPRPGRRKATECVIRCGPCPAPPTGKAHHGPPDARRDRGATGPAIPAPTKPRFGRLSRAGGPGCGRQLSPGCGHVVAHALGSS